MIEISKIIHGIAEVLSIVTKFLNKGRSKEIMFKITEAVFAVAQVLDSMNEPLSSSQKREALRLLIRFVKQAPPGTIEKLLNARNILAELNSAELDAYLGIALAGYVSHKPEIQSPAKISRNQNIKSK